MKLAQGSNCLSCQAAENSASVAHLTTELSAVSGERDDLSRQVFTARAEREDMASLAERRQADLTSLTEDVARTQTAKVKISSQFLVQPSLCPLITCILIRLEG